MRWPRLDYPDFEVIVIDNNTTDPALWRPVAEHCARLGARFRFFHLGIWPGFKAGALNFALRETGAGRRGHRRDRQRLHGARPTGCAHGAVFRRPQESASCSRRRTTATTTDRFKRLMFWEYAGFFHIGMVTAQRAQRDHPARHHDAGPPHRASRRSAAGPSGASPRTPSSGCACSARLAGDLLPRAASATA